MDKMALDSAEFRARQGAARDENKEIEKRGERYYFISLHFFGCRSARRDGVRFGEVARLQELEQ
jgi:hypothetical protein